MTSRRSFVLGVVAGTFATVVIMVVGVVVGAKLYARHVERTLEERIGPPPVPESVSADYSWVGLALDGAAFHAESLRGKWIVLTFWKPDCFSCVEQLDYLAALADRVKDTAIEFAAVSTGGHAETQETAARLNSPLPVYVLNSARPAVFETPTLPTTFVLSPAGKIAFRYGGIARWDDPAVETYLRGLIAESTP